MGVGAGVRGLSSLIALFGILKAIPPQSTGRSSRIATLSRTGSAGSVRSYAIQNAVSHWIRRWKRAWAAVLMTLSDLSRGRVGHFARIGFLGPGATTTRCRPKSAPEALPEKCLLT